MRKNSVSIILYLFVFAVLGKLLSAVAGLGDAAELIASSYVLGVSHPPGYPLFNMLGRIFTCLPLGSIAMRVNLASAFGGAITLLVVFLIVLELGKSQLFALLAALIGLSGHLFLEQSLNTEVYIFNAAFVFAVFYLLTRRSSIWLLTTFLISLAFSIHYLILAVVPIFIIKLLTSQQIRRGRIILQLFFVVLLGLSSLTYMPLRAIKGAPVNWGSPHKITHFVNHVIRKQYKDLEFRRVVTFKDKILFFKKFISQTLAQFHGLLILLIAGLFFYYSRRKIPWEIALLFLLAGPGIILLLQFKFEEVNLLRLQAYYLPAFLSLIILMGLGLKSLQSLLKKLPYRTALISLAVLAYITFLFSLNGRANNNRHNYLSYDFARNMLHSLPLNAVLFTEGDNKTTPFCYTLLVEGRRLDLNVYDRSRNLFDDIFKSYKVLTRSTKKTSNEEIERYLVDHYIKSRPVLFSLWQGTESFPDYNFFAYGFFNAVIPTGKPRPNPLAPFQYLNYRFKKDELKFKDYLSQDVVSNYYYHLGKAFIELGELQRAANVFGMLKRFGASLKHVHNNLGVLLKRFGYTQAAARELQEALRLDPNFIEAAYNLALLAEKIDRQTALRQWHYYLKTAAGDPKESLYIEKAHRRIKMLQ